MALSAVFFSSMAVFVKKLSGRVPSSEAIFFRGGLNLLLVLPLAARERNWMPNGQGLLVLRGVAGFAALVCFFHSIAELPLSVAALINWSSPVFVILISRFTVGEAFPLRGWIGVACALTGLSLLLRPIGGWGHAVGASIPPLTALIAVLGSFFSSVAYVAIRAASHRVGPHTIVLYFSAVVTLLSLPLGAHEGFSAWGFEKEVLIALVAMGGFASVGQIAMTQAYRHAKAGVAATMNLMTAAFSTVWGAVLFHENLSLIQWTGMLGLALGILLATVPFGMKKAQ
jgi:drug/metabolite transporter (DMT)-like permease